MDQHPGNVVGELADPRTGEGLAGNVLPSFCSDGQTRVCDSRVRQTDGRWPVRVVGAHSRGGRPGWKLDSGRRARRRIAQAGIHVPTLRGRCDLEPRDCHCSDALQVPKGVTLPAKGTLVEGCWVRSADGSESV